MPPPGDDSLTRLVTKLRMTAFRGLLRSSEPALSGVRGALAELAKRDPDRVLDAVGAPDVLVPLLVRHRDGGDRPELVRAAIPHLLAALADSLPAGLRWTAPVDAIADRDEGALRGFDPPATELSVGADGVEAIGGAETRTRPFHPLAPGPPGLHLSEYDGNPLAMTEAHPDKQGNAVDLGGRPVSAWTEALGEALAAIEIALPAWFGELDRALTRIVPVGYDRERHLSASYREAPGLAYLSLHPSALTMAEAIVHEAQHSKLNTMLYFDPLLENGATQWAKSEVRPDLRPLSGVLLAVHAFVPVAELHRALAAAGHPIASAPEFADRRAEVIETNARGLDTLRRLGEPTRVGRTLLDGLQAVHDHTAAALGD